MKFDVVINTDDNYIQHCMAMLCSLFENNKSHNIDIHVLTHHLNEKNRTWIKKISNRYENNCYFYIVDESRLGNVQFRKERPLSKAAYYRLLLSSILPDSIKKILYLDCDIIVLRDVSEIFALEIEDYALAATLDNFPYSQQHRLQLHLEVDDRTFCSGVMLVNLCYWRKHSSEEQLLEYANRHRKEVYLHDQDVLNYQFKRKWFLLPPKWNRTALSLFPTPFYAYKHFDYKDYRKFPMLIHYADLTVKPWMKIKMPNKKYYLTYLKQSKYTHIKFESVTFPKKLLIYRRYIILYLKRIIELVKNFNS